MADGQTVIATDESAPESGAAPAVPSSIRNPQSAIRNPLVLLSLITLLGAFLRLISLDRPAIWGDEAFTYSRVCAGFRQMLDVLQFNGFMPLHYIVYWWMGQHAELSPVMMRLPVAIAGIFMPPAMYFLARQFQISVKTALVVALFTACSAYMLCYSRDAKMYMPFWTFCTVHVACLLWWMNGRGSSNDHPTDPDLGLIRRMLHHAWRSLLAIPSSPQTFRYLCWLAAGAGMVGYQALGRVILAVQVVIFLTHPRLHWKQIAPFVLGIVLLYGITWVYFDRFTDWDNRVDENWNASGVQWVDGYNRGRGGAELLRFTATAFLMSWEWPLASWYPAIDPRVLKTMMTVSIVFGVIALAGLLPWRLRRVGAAHVGNVDSEQTTWASPTLRGTFQVLAWLLVPAYAFYCDSISSGRVPYTEKGGTVFVSPMYFLRNIGTFCGDHWIIASIVAVGLLAWCFFSARTWKRCGLNAVAIVVAAMLLLGLLWAVYGIELSRARSAMVKGEAWHSVWMPRYLGVLWPAFALALCVLIMRLPTRGLRIGVISLLLAVNLTQFSVRVWGGSEPRTDLLTADIAAGQPLAVRQQQLALDVMRQSYAMVTGQPVRISKITQQFVVQPLVAPISRVYIQTGLPSPAPGGGVGGSTPFKYYLCELIGVQTNPNELRRMRASLDRNWFYVIGTAPRLIAADARKAPSITTIITWDRIDPTRRDAAYVDPLPPALGPSWRRVKEDLFTARDHWTWMHLYQLRRREYLRIKPAAPTTQAATQPTTQRQ